MSYTTELSKRYNITTSTNFRCNMANLKSDCGFGIRMEKDDYEFGIRYDTEDGPAAMIKKNNLFGTNINTKFIVKDFKNPKFGIEIIN